jgi:hypothetical protein
MLKQEDLAQYDTIVISIFVPKAKPLNQFDIQPQVIESISTLLHNKNCILYVFGNPYALQVIPNLALAKEIIMVYQDFEVFQEVAAQQFLNKLACPGLLPVSIKNI